MSNFNLTPVTRESTGTPLQMAIKATREDRNRLRMFECRSCDEVYGEEYDARNCCPPSTVYVCPSCEVRHYSVEAALQCEKGHGAAGLSALERSRCPVCDSHNDSLQDAIDCCMWRTLGWAERRALAIRLGNDALALHDFKMVH